MTKDDLIAFGLLEKLKINGEYSFDMKNEENYIFCEIIDKTTTPPRKINLELIKDVKERLYEIVNTNLLGYKLIPTELLSEVTGFDENLLNVARYNEETLPLVINIIEVESENIIDSLDDDGALKCLDNYYFGDFKEVFEIGDEKYFVFVK